MRKAYYWETLLSVAAPLFRDHHNVWRGVVFGIMEVFAPDDVRDRVETVWEARGHRTSGSIIILDGQKKGGGKRAGRKRRQTERASGGSFVAAFVYDPQGEVS